MPRPAALRHGPAALAASLLLLAACAGGDATSPGATGPRAPATPPAPTTGALAVELAGLPPGVPAAVRVTGPALDRTLTATTTLGELPPGDYVVAAAPIVAPVGSFTPDTASRTLALRAGQTVTARVRFDITTGALAIQHTGLPQGAAPRFVLRGPADTGAATGRDLRDSTSVANLPPGRYVLHVPPSRSDSGTWRPAADSIPLTVVAQLEPLRVPVEFRALPSRLVVEVHGLPAGAEAAVRLRGPQADRLLTGSQRLDSLARGEFAIEAAAVRAAGFSWAPDSARRTRLLRAGDSLDVAVRYAVTTGALAVQVTGLPEGAAGAVRVSGPEGFTRLLTATTTLTDLAPGDYDVTADSVRIAPGRYDPAVPRVRVAVRASITAAPAVIEYRPAPGRLMVGVQGAPQGATPTVTLAAASGGWTRALQGGAEVADVPAGVVRVTGEAFVLDGDQWRATPATQEVTVPPGGTASAQLVYAVATGRLTLTPSGLPAAASPSVVVTGPAGFTRTLTLKQPVTLSGLEPGSYQVAGQPFVDGGIPWAATQPQQSASVGRGATSTLVVTWAAQGTLPNLVLEGAYVTQVVQRFAGTVPLVADRAGFLRVFVRATQANAWRPPVRVRLYDGATLVLTSTLAAPEGSVRTALDEGTLGSTWNLPIPAGQMRPSLRVLVDVDPQNTIAEASEADNVWPRSGQPQPIDVRSVPALPIRFVPVVNGGRTGNVSVANVESYLATARRLFPLGVVNASVRATPYTTTAPELRSDDQNDAWETTLSEINALRVAEGPAGSYYYGVVRVGYTSGIAGMGYVPGRASIGWDHLPSGDGVAAHELGHNFGRFHAPCGVAGDPAYPYSGGQIGVWGFNLSVGALVPPTRPDLMGYCGNAWISDWTWTAVMSHRQAVASAVVDVAGTDPDQPQTAQREAPPAATRALLVWGRIVGDRVLVEPAFTLDRALPTPEAPSGAWIAEGRDAAGGLLFAHRFDAPAVDHGEAGARHFALAVPIAAAVEGRLAAIEVRAVAGPARGRQARAAGAALPDGEVVDVARTASGVITLGWQGTAARMALVRDARTGEILSFVRGPGASVRAGPTVDVLLSDGVRSRRASPRIVTPR